MTGPDGEGIQAEKPVRALPTRQLNGSGNTAERRHPTVLSPLVAGDTPACYIPSAQCTPAT